MQVQGMWNDLVWTVDAAKIVLVANLIDVTLIDSDRLRTGKSWQFWRGQTLLSVEPGWAI